MTDSMKTHNMEQRITAIRARLKRLSTEQEKLEQDSAEKIDETLLFHGESGRFAIYQMDTGGEQTYQIMGIESAKKLG